jgi:hypothetical protein
VIYGPAPAFDGPVACTLAADCDSLTDCSCGYGGSLEIAGD